ncbi:hypothetical protein GGS21DRAFT_375754 [Xylaria nigripes]|nr:hypothetical protein GGS21DRAFT_375754 [Xylaria nigripes]
MSTSVTITVTLSQVAKSIDHYLLNPTLTDSEITAGLELAKKLKVATACVKPYSVSAARNVLEGTGVAICSVIGFPHGNSTTHIKVLEAEEAMRDGAHEIDMVVNVGKVLGGDWEYVTNEIRAINDTVVKHGATLKVIFENDLLEDHHIVRLCKICAAFSVAFVITSTGYGFVKQSNGLFMARGATLAHLRLMKASIGPSVHIKAAGGIRTLDGLLFALSAGATRIGTLATESIMQEAVARGIGATPVQIALLVPA